MTGVSDVLADMCTHVSLGQREWDYAKSQQQERVKRAANKMRFHPSINARFYNLNWKRMIVSKLWTRRQTGA